MDLRQKLHILADAAKYDASCASSGAKRKGAGGGWGGIGNTDGTGICHSYTPDGRCVSLLKILLTNHCLYDCQYCVNRISSDIPRARFTPDEVVQLTLDFYRRNYIEGLFLSSGIIQSVDYTMEQLIAAIKTLRLTHGFNGYIHLKAIPGASPALLHEAGLYADRLSANIELPTAPDLQRLAPQKTIAAITHSMTAIKYAIDDDKLNRPKPARTQDSALRTQHSFAPAGQSTQMIVGATETPDAAILQTASNLYSRFRLKRVYYSAYSPIQNSDPRLPAHTPPLIREHRLYQADWLIRHYGFRADEITAGPAENLSLDLDPKLAWALRYRHHFPVDLNTAPREKLLRVPGLGVCNVDRLLQLRRFQKIRLPHLLRLKVPLKRTRPFIITADHHPDSLLLDSPTLATSLAGGRLSRKNTQQLSLFETFQPALTGQL